MAAGASKKGGAKKKKGAAKPEKPASTEACYLPLAEMPTVEAGESHFLSLPLPPEWLMDKGGEGEGSSNTSQETPEDDSPPPTGSPPRTESRRRLAAPEAAASEAPLQQGTKGKKAKGVGKKAKGGGKVAKGGGKTGSKKKSAAASSAAASKPAAKASPGVFSDKQLATVALAREKQERIDRRQAAAAAAAAAGGLPDVSSSHAPASPRRQRPSPPSVFSEKDASMAILLGLAGMKPRPRSSALMDDMSFGGGDEVGNAGMTPGSRQAMAV